MEIRFTGNPLRRPWRRSSRGYARLSPNHRRSAKNIVRFGRKRPWRLHLKLAPKLRLGIMAATSPLKLWRRFKNAYMKMMLRLADASGTSNGCDVFGGKRIPRARELQVAYSRTEFENRLILEICKSMAASLELGYSK